MKDLSPGSRAARVRDALHGVAVMTPTPFTVDGRDVDASRVAPTSSFLAEHGIRLLIPCGNVGEFHSLTFDEWRVVVSETVSAAGGAIVVPGIGGSLRDAVRMAECARELGAAGVMLLPFHHTYTSTAGVRAYMEALLQLEFPLVVYLRGEALPESILETLASNPWLVGAKFAQPDVRRLARLTRLTSTSALAWSCGLAELSAPMYWLAGARGFTSGVANFAPRLTLAIFDALERGDFYRALELVSLVSPFEELRARQASANNVPAVKEAMELFGRPVGPVRAPLSELSIGDRRELEVVVGHIRELEEQMTARA